MHSIRTSSEFYSGKNKTRVNNDLLREAGISEMPTNSNIMENSRSSEYKQESISNEHGNQNFYHTGKEFMPYQKVSYENSRPISEGSREFYPNDSYQNGYNDMNIYNNDFHSNEEKGSNLYLQTSERMPKCAECEGAQKCLYCGTSYRNNKSINKHEFNQKGYYKRNHSFDNYHAERENTRLLSARRNLVKAYDEAVRAKNNEKYSRMLNKGIAEACHKCGCTTKFLVKKDNFEKRIISFNHVNHSCFHNDHHCENCKCCHCSSLQSAREQFALNKIEEENSHQKAYENQIGIKSDFNNIERNNPSNIISQRYNRDLEKQNLVSTQNSMKSLKYVNIDEMENKLNAYLHQRESRIPNFSAQISPKSYSNNNDQFIVYGNSKKRENSNYKRRYQKIPHFGNVMQEAFREVPREVPYIREKMLYEKNRWKDFPSANEMRLLNNKKSYSNKIEKSNYYYPTFKPAPFFQKKLFNTNYDLIHDCKCMENNFYHDQEKEFQPTSKFCECAISDLKINSKYLGRAKIPNLEWARKYEEYFPINRKQKIISHFELNPAAKKIYANGKNLFKKRIEDNNFEVKNTIHPKSILINSSGSKSWNMGKYSSAYKKNSNRFQNCFINTDNPQKHVRWEI